MKKPLLLFILTLLIALPKVGQAQITFRYGGELGLAFSQFPKKYSFKDDRRRDKVTEKVTPLYGPLVGITSELTVLKHIQLTFGAQYQMAGQRYHSHKDGYDLLYHQTYTYDEWVEQTFHKVALPVSAGYTFKAGKLQPSLFVGYRHNYFIKGKHRRKFVLDHTDPTQDTESEREFNPFNTGYSANSSGFQLFGGISSLIGQHMKFSFTYHLGATEVQYSQYRSSHEFNSYDNNDYVISMAYLFPVSKKR